MADKSNQLILEALHRAASEPAGVPLFTTKKSPGYFQAAGPGSGGTVPSAGSRVRTIGKGPPKLCDHRQGLDYLLSAEPKQVLEDWLDSSNDARRRCKICQLGRSWLERWGALRDVVGAAAGLPGQDQQSAQGVRTICRNVAT